LQEKMEPEDRDPELPSAFGPPQGCSEFFTDESEVRDGNESLEENATFNHPCARAPRGPMVPVMRTAQPKGPSGIVTDRQVPAAMISRSEFSRNAPPKGQTTGRPRLRLLHVVPCLATGGMEHGVVRLIRCLGDEEFEHAICAVRSVDRQFAERMGI